jgi:hypothetical protein
VVAEGRKIDGIGGLLVQRTESGSGSAEESTEWALGGIMIVIFRKKVEALCFASSAASNFRLQSS